MNSAGHQYLGASETIDWETPGVFNLAKEIAGKNTSDEQISKLCFEWVRDHIRHSGDHELNPVTCSASDVLQHKTGYCYAKSHLLVALLRANNIPAGLCYQRLSINESGAPYCLHGLVAVHLQRFGWYRIDPRGNKEGVDAQFTPPIEQLAFTTTDPLEADLPEIWADPLLCVTTVLNGCSSYLEVNGNFPDLEILGTLNPSGSVVSQ